MHYEILIYIYRDRYICNYVCINRIKHNEETFSVMANYLQKLLFKTRFLKSGLICRRQPTAPNNTKTMICKIWNCPVEYPIWENKFDIKEFDDNMFNPIFLTKVKI